MVQAKEPLADAVGGIAAVKPKRPLHSLGGTGLLLADEVDSVAFVHRHGLDSG